mmetsp:Transcript_10143/g.16396  ORF Transcript_10143/g.16396 Transcript_10143/m.16396 type:complete len:215 (+) Transcript_10143:2-646(+)
MASGSRRNLPGTKRAGLFAWDGKAEGKGSGPDDFKHSGQYSVQEYIQALIRADPSNVEKICSCPDSVHPDEWLYEHLRQFMTELNVLIVQLSPNCDSTTFPKMTAGEACEFLSACDGEPKMVSAIDYCCHNLDFYIAALNRNKNFPRPHHGALPKKASKEMKEATKRLYRVMAHAYYHHKDFFVKFEERTHLYQRLAALNKGYQLTRFTPPIQL